MKIGNLIKIESKTYPYLNGAIGKIIGLPERKERKNQVTYRRVLDGYQIEFNPPHKNEDGSTTSLIMMLPFELKVKED